MVAFFNLLLYGLCIIIIIKVMINVAIIIIMEVIFLMNMLEQYLVPGYQVREMTVKEKQQAKIPVEERWIWYDGKINCYGSVSKISRPFFIDDWKTTESQGYFMA